MVLYYDKTGIYGHQGRYLLLSRSKPRKVLYIFGKARPSFKAISKQERRIQFFKSGKIPVVSHKRRRPRR